MYSTASSLAAADCSDQRRVRPSRSCNRRLATLRIVSTLKDCPKTRMRQARDLPNDRAGCGRALDPLQSGPGWDCPEARKHRLRDQTSPIIFENLWNRRNLRTPPERKLSSSTPFIPTNPICKSARVGQKRSPTGSVEGLAPSRPGLRASAANYVPPQDVVRVPALGEKRSGNLGKTHAKARSREAIPRSTPPQAIPDALLDRLFLRAFATSRELFPPRFSSQDSPVL